MKLTKKILDNLRQPQWSSEQPQIKENQKEWKLIYPSKESLELAAQCWCDSETADIEMDTCLANAFAKRLDDINFKHAKALNKLKMYAVECLYDGGSDARMLLKELAPDWVDPYHCERMSHEEDTK